MAAHASLTVTRALPAALLVFASLVTASRAAEPRMSFTWPICAKPIAGFGYRVDPFTGRVVFHSGIDVGREFGLTIRAAASGTVLRAEEREPYGLLLEIDHGSGYRTRYGHLQSFAVRTGEAVARGQFIGRVGSSGKSTGPHLHFEIWFNDVVRNPLHYLNGECGR